MDGSSAIYLRERWNGLLFSLAELNYINIEKFRYMENVYAEASRMLKALSDPKRLQIVDMLSCRELCACEILEAFQVRQPTLSHDMKVLMEAGLVNDRRVGKNTYYSLNQGKLSWLKSCLRDITTPKAECICNTGKR